MHTDRKEETDFYIHMAALTSPNRTTNDPFCASLKSLYDEYQCECSFAFCVLSEELCGMETVS